MQTTIRPAPLIAERLSDRQVGHALIMAVLPDNLGGQPRSTAGALWRYVAGTQLLTIQATTPIRSDLIGEVMSSRELPTPATGTRWQIDVEIACLKTPPSAVPVEIRPALKAAGRSYRSRKVTVPEAEREEWAIRRLARSGFAVDATSLSIGPLGKADLGRRGGAIPYVQVRAAGTVTDADAWTARLRSGSGPGLSFGLGLILTEPAPVTSSTPTPSSISVH